MFILFSLVHSDDLVDVLAWIWAILGSEPRTEEPMRVASKGSKLNALLLLLAALVFAER